MSRLSISRRAFLAIAGAAGLTALGGCGRSSQTDDAFDSDGNDDGRTQRVAYRLSTRGKRASRAAKAHAANKLFATPEAANIWRAHPGDTSAVVQIDMAEATWLFHFGAGALVVDLRQSASFARIAKKLWDKTFAVNVNSMLLATSVTPQQVAERLERAAGAPIDPAWIEMPLIDRPGKYPARLFLPRGTPVPFVLEV